MSEKISIIGLGYVGLPVAVALGKVFDHVVGFDINKTRISELTKGIDKTNEVPSEDLKKTKTSYSDKVNSIADSTFYIVTVPTPVDNHKRPDLRPVESACKSVGPFLKKGDIVVFESTVYPGVTEEFCGPILEQASGLKAGSDFFLGYSPERINPGDKERRLETITKVISAQTTEALVRVRRVYMSIIKAGVYEASSIKVAEAAKVIENTQRDLNIALVNELAIIFNKLGIRTKDVLEAAGTKWNFLKFSPGLVGGHCIGVDPYYLTARAEQEGYHPQVILSGRRINDGMGQYVTEQIIRKMIEIDMPIKRAKIGIFGLTFKENVPDLRNSRVPDIINGLKCYGPQPLVHDPHADKEEAKHEYNIDLDDLSEFQDLDVLILAVPHKEYAEQGVMPLVKRLKQNALLVDIKSMFNPLDIPAHLNYWSL